MTSPTHGKPDSTAPQLPLFPVDPEEPPALLRYAKNVPGLLSQRDPQRLRRFILDARDPQEQDLRQTELLVQSTTCLTTGRHDPSRQALRHERIVNMGLFACPVAICMAQSLRVRSYFHFDTPTSVGLRTELERAWARGLGVSASDVAVHGVVDARHLVGMGPLTLQSFMRKSDQRLRKLASALKEVDQTFHASQSDSEPWALLAPPEALSAVGRNQPVPFLLAAFVSWDHQECPPVWSEPTGSSTQRLQSLLEALFTHALPSPVGQSALEAQRRVRTYVRLGHPQPLHAAMTQAQAMQLAWMAERARQTDCSFEFEQRQDRDILTWAARLTDAFEAECGHVEYSYDGFWRPTSHVQTISEQVSLAQATGQMRPDSSLAPQTH